MLALCLVLPQALRGQSDTLSPGPLVTDRPDQTESTNIVPRGFVQIEAGWSLEAARDAGVSVHTHTLPGMLARVGLSRALEARFGFTGFQLTSPAPAAGGSSGLGDAELGFKYRVATARGWAPEVALIGAVSVPTGSTGVTSGRLDPSFLLTLSRPLGDRWSVGSNLGSSWTTTDASGSRTTVVDLTYTLTLGAGLLERIGMFAETFGSARVQGGTASLTVDGGFTWLVRDNLQLDLSAGRGIDGGGAVGHWLVAAGAAVRFPR